MKKQFLLSFAILAICCNVFAGTVSQQSAQTVALNYFKLNAPNANSANITATLAYTKTETSGAVDFYVFNMAPVKGFVIVTADDNLEPVIGYSTESNFATNFENVGVKDWTETIAAKINYALRAGVTASSEISNLWSSYRQGINPVSSRASSVGPLTTTTWDQENDISTPPPYIYNLFCPYNSSEGERCVTGCVATAMAQIMKYWNYPATGTGSYSYTPPGYPTQSANFGATTYNWANMPNELTDSTSGSQDSAVDLISYQAGVAVAMEYGTDEQGGSGAYVIQSDVGSGQPCAQQAYVKYFGYNSSTIQGLHASSYTSSAWATLIENELNAGRVVQYAGFEPKNEGGHTWVCDGYNSSGLFHMNWGWMGIDNGYYSLSNLNPSPYTFNVDDEALIGIEPGTTASCSAPTGLATNNITTSSATFSWSAVSGASSYNIQYQIVGASTWTSATASTNSYPASGLTSGSNYQWEVQTVCTAGGSSTFSSLTFSTSAGSTCSVPSALGASVTDTNAVLTWGAVSGSEGYSLQWKASSASGWNTVTGLTSNTYTLSGLSSCTSYQYEVQTVCSGGSSAYSSAASLTTGGCAITYCASSASSQAYEYIKNVTLGSIDNTTAAAGYANYTNLSTNLAGGSSATITLTPGFTSSAYAEYFTVYIDYNQNGLFTDAGETVAKVEGTKAVSKAFTIPTTALNGPTRMRVQMQYGAYETNPCASYTYGGVQDYTVNITGNATVEIGAPVTAQDLAGIKLYPNPAQNDLTIQFNSDNDGNVHMNVYNLTGQRVISGETTASTGGNIVDINTSQLSNGVYIFELDNNGSVQRQKFVITR